MKLFIISIFVFVCLIPKAQVMPPDGAELNYNQIMLEYPPVPDAAYYKINVDETSRALIREGEIHLEQIDSTTATLIEELHFGQSYAWKVTAYNDNGQELSTSETYNFKIKMSDYIKNFRFRLNKHYEGPINDGVIFLDYCRVAVDRLGRPVWFFPRADMTPDHVDIRTTQLNIGGYVTMLPQPNAMITTLDGRILWRSPKGSEISNTKIEFLHHEFIELDNGNYMTLSKRYLADTLFHDDTVCTVGYSTILEYAPDGNLVWSWSAENYIMEEDLDREMVLKKQEETETYGHANGIAFDQENGFIYLSFRDLNSIIKIDYATGEVLEQYGDGLESWGNSYAQGEFMRQHSPVLVANNQLLFFNNNDTTEVSEVLIMSLADSTKGDIIWQFDCDFDPVGDGNSFKMGSVQQMPNGNILVGMGYNPRLFEVTPDGNVVWDGVPEVYTDQDGWRLKENYRIQYASSLYPTYYTLALKNNVLTIYNEGSESDTYMVKIMEGENSDTSMHGVDAGQSVSINLTNCESCVVEVSSGNNKYMSRTVTVDREN